MRRLYQWIWCWSSSCTVDAKSFQTSSLFLSPIPVWGGMFQIRNNASHDLRSNWNLSELHPGLAKRSGAERTPAAPPPPSAFHRHHPLTAFTSASRLGCELKSANMLVLGTRHPHFINTTLWFTAPPTLLSSSPPPTRFTSVHSILANSRCRVCFPTWLPPCLTSLLSWAVSRMTATTTGRTVSRSSATAMVFLESMTLARKKTTMTTRRQPAP